MPDERTPLVADQPLQEQDEHLEGLVKPSSRPVRIYLVLLSVLFTFPLASSQIVLYDLLFAVVCRHLDISASECSSNPKVAGEVANLLSTVSLLNGVLATGVMVVLSALSDGIGRKYGILWFMVFTTLGTAAFPTIAFLVPASVSHWRMLVPYTLTALGGTPTLMLNLSVLYITDCLSDPATRTKYLSLLLGVSMLVQAAAPGLGGAFLQKSGISTAKYLGICATWMAVGTVIFGSVIKDVTRRSPPNESFENSQTSYASKLRAVFMNALRTLTFKECDSRLRQVNAWILLLNFFLSNEFALGFIDLIMVYAKHSFGWVAARVGQSLFLIFATRTAWALVGFPLVYSQLTRLWPATSDNVDKADLVHMYLCNILTFLGYAALGLARTSAQYTGALVILANDGVAGPIWINALFKYVPENQRGEFMAALSLINKPAGALLPALLMKLYQLTIDSRPQLVFNLVCLMAALLTSTLLLIKPSHQAS